MCQAYKIQDEDLFDDFKDMNGMVREVNVYDGMLYYTHGFIFR